jgi:cytochrome oxidase assembly protein ShyY1
MWPMIAFLLAGVCVVLGVLFVLTLWQIRRQGRQITELRRDRNEWRAVVFRVRELWVATSGENTPAVAFEDFAAAMETLVREVQP